MNMSSLRALTSSSQFPDPLHALGTRNVTLSTVQLDALLVCNVSLGTAYTGVLRTTVTAVNSTHRIGSSSLTITISDARLSGNPQIGSFQCALRASLLLNSSFVATTSQQVLAVRYQLLSSLVSTAITPAIAGDWGQAGFGYRWGVIDALAQITPTAIEPLVSNAIPFNSMVSHPLGEHALAASSNRLFAIGCNTYQQLGIASVSGSCLSQLAQVSLNSTIISPPSSTQISLSSITSISAGVTHSLVLDSQRYLWVTGSNVFGQLCLSPSLGIDTFAPLDLDTLIPFVTFTAVTAGDGFSMLIGRSVTSTAVIYSCGRAFSSVYTPYSANSSISVLQILSHSISSTVIAVDAGRDHVLMLDSQGQVWCLGSNRQGQCGYPASIAYLSTPQLVNITADGSSQSIVSLSAGAFHSLLIDRTGRVLCFGKNTDRQCTADSQYLYSPIVIPNSTLNYGYPITVEGGSAHSFIVDAQVRRVARFLTSHAFYLTGVRLRFWMERQWNHR